MKHPLDFLDPVPDPIWTETEGICPECGGELEFFDSGEFRGVKWICYICKDCAYKLSNEPDYD